MQLTTIRDTWNVIMVWVLYIIYESKGEITVYRNIYRWIKIYGNSVDIKKLTIFEKSPDKQNYFKIFNKRYNLKIP